MTEKVSWNLNLSRELSDSLDDIAERSGTDRAEVMRLALALMKIAHDAKEHGRHVGIVSDPDRLDTEIVGLI